MAIRNFTAAEWDALTRAAEITAEVWRDLDTFDRGSHGREIAALRRALSKAEQLAPKGS